MSTSKFDASGLMRDSDASESAKNLTLPCDAVTVCKNGIEFRSAKPITTWTEMSIDLECPKGETKLNCHGIVVSCNGNRHAGYIVSMVFIDLTPQAQQKLNLIALSH